MPRLQFQSLGSALDVGASCHALSDETRTILLDAGRHPKRSGTESLPWLDALTGPPPRTIVISHCHNDHVGALPVLADRYPKSQILLSEANKVLAPRMLINAARVMQRNAGERAEEVLFDFDDVDDLSRRLTGVELHQPVTPSGRVARGTPDVTLMLRDAGHVLGATSIEVVWHGHRIFYTGDISLVPQGIIDGAELPSGCDTLIMEGTLGLEKSLDELDRDAEIDRYLDATAQVLDAGGSVLSPCFALGRTQEMLYIVDAAIQAGRLPDVPVYIGGLGRAVSEIYDATVHLHRRADPGFLAGWTDAEVLEPDHADRDDPFTKPSIYLVTSGMLMPMTPSYRLAQRMLTNPKHAIYFVGYVDRDAAGHPIYVANQGEEIRWQGSPVPVKALCDLDRFRFTAHARRRDLLEIVERTQPSRVILVHGDPGALEAIRDEITERHAEMRVEIAWPRRPIVLVDDSE